MLLPPALSGQHLNWSAFDSLLAVGVRLERQDLCRWVELRKGGIERAMSLMTGVARRRGSPSQKPSYRASGRMS
jgi:hypothetical protein